MHTLKIKSLREPANNAIQVSCSCIRLWGRHTERTLRIASEVHLAVTERDVLELGGKVAGDIVLGIIAGPGGGEAARSAREGDLGGVELTEVELDAVVWGVAHAELLGCGAGAGEALPDDFEINGDLARGDLRRTGTLACVDVHGGDMWWDCASGKEEVKLAIL